MTATADLSDEQAYWLRRVLISRPGGRFVDHFVLPDDVHDALVEKNFIRWGRADEVEITLEGIHALSAYTNAQQNSAGNR